MGAVFVSYRRGDSEGQARALSLELVRLFGKDSVFMDVDSIALGRDFRQALQDRLSSCDIMFVLIGPGWLDAKDGSGARRLETSTDFVRQEVAAALKRNIPVIPVLLQGAQVPPPERLPDDLKELSYRNAFELGHSTWESDVREMIKRLDLRPANATDSRPSDTTREAPQVSTTSPSLPWRQPRIVAALVLVVVVAGFLTYRYVTKENQHALAAAGPESQSSTAAALPLAGVSGTTPLATQPSTPDGSLAVSGLEFLWPGDDCWDIYRGAELVSYQCGAKKQALGAGRYTIKGRHAPVFLPFDVNVKSGIPTQVSLGGVFEFAWPGDDCWNVLRDAELVTFQCGAKKQALSAGRYTITGRHASVFEPFTVAIKDGSLTRTVMGGVFEFRWPGDDCWNIFRGAEIVIFQCGAKKQALGAGRYTIKGRHAPLFNPFDITVTDGANVVKTP